MKKKKNVGFRATEARHEELKIIAAKRHQSIQKMLELGLNLLLPETPSTAPRSTQLHSPQQHSVVEFSERLNALHFKADLLLDKLNEVAQAVHGEATEFYNFVASRSQKEALDEIKAAEPVRESDRDKSRHPKNKRAPA